jgi:hypothetical protein
VQPVEEFVGRAGAVDPDQDLAADPGAALVSRQLTQGGADDGDVVGGGGRRRWSAAVFDPALPGRSSAARGSPVPSGPWSTNAHNGWCPKPFLNVGAAPCSSEWAVTSVASTSMTSRRAASAA